MGNAVVHFEIGAADDQPLVAFYGQLFGWGLEFMPEGGYTLIDTRGGGGINGGIGKSQTGEPWSTFYVEADDLQAVLDRATSLGAATVMPVTDFGGMVTIAMFNDPDGARPAPHESTRRHAITCLTVLVSAGPRRQTGTCVTAGPSAPLVMPGQCPADPGDQPCRPEPAAPFLNSSNVASDQPRSLAVARRLTDGPSTCVTLASSAPADATGSRRRSAGLDGGGWRGRSW
jgi:predicted enzyme related to lactoylglutathione lyase